MFNSDFIRSLFFALSALALLYFSVKDKIKKEYALIGLCVLTTFDLVGVSKRYFNNNDFTTKRRQKGELVQMTKADQMILQDKSLSYRVLNLTVSPFNDATTSYYHKSIGGYHGAKIRRYQDVIEQHISKNNQGVLDMLNTKYLITREPKQPVVLSPTHAGNAWFVDTVKYVNSPDEEIASLEGIKPKEVAYIDQSKFQIQKLQYDSAAREIKLTEYKPNHLTYTANAETDGFAVFSEVYYEKGWQAYIDGKETDHVRVNYILRGLEIPKGEHQIEFKFRPKTFFIGNKIALFSSWALILMVAGVLVLEFKKQKVEEGK